MFNRYSMTLMVFGALFALVPLYGNSYIFPSPESGNPMLAISLVASFTLGIITGLRKEIPNTRFSTLIYFFFGSCMSLTIVGFFHNPVEASIGQTLLAAISFVILHTADPASEADKIKARKSRVLL